MWPISAFLRLSSSAHSIMDFRPSGLILQSSDKLPSLIFQSPRMRLLIHPVSSTSHPPSIGQYSLAPRHLGLRLGRWMAHPYGLTRSLAVHRRNSSFPKQG